MLLLNLATDPDAAGALRAGLPARRSLPARRRATFGSSAPVTLAFDIFKDKDQFRLVGPGADHAGAAVQPVSRAVHAGRSTRRSTCAISRARRDTGEGEREIEEDDLTTAFYEDDEIDLGQLMHEQFYLALPMKPLCRDDCKGLCAMCGTNLNRGDVRLRARVGRSAARGVEGAEEANIREPRDGRGT